MLRKRPLCVAVLAAAALLLLLPSGIWMKASIPEGVSPAEGLTGKVCRMESRNEGQAVYLKGTPEGCCLSDDEILLIYFDAEQPFSIGNTIRIEPPYRIWEPEAPANPGQFDARLYYQTQHITHLGSAKNASVIEGNVFWPGELLRRLRENLSIRCMRLFGETNGGVIRAMLLGDKAELGDETKNIYQKSGMSHLLAISGLHISIVGMSLYRFLRKKGCSYGISGSIGMIVVLLYGTMTGMSTSTARAVTMFVLAVLADLLGCSYDMLTALAAAALLLLIEQPLHVYSASFLLSFGAVMGVGILYPAVRSLFTAPHKLGDAFLVSLSIQIATLPLIQWFYWEFPLYSVFLNLLVIPLMGVLMFCGMGALGISFLSWQAAGVPAFLCRMILSFYESLGEGTLRLPWSVIVCGRPKYWQMFLYYGGILGFVLWRSRVKEREKWRLCMRTAKGEEAEQEEEQHYQKGRRRWEKKISLALALLLCCCLQLRFYGGFSFTMLDVGQGDGLFLRTEAGTTCLIDGGSSDVKQVGRYRILPFLKEQGVGTLDYVFITHTDKDHISGVEELLEQAGEPGGMRVGALLLSEQSAWEETGIRLRELAEAAGTDVKIIKAGMILTDKSTKLYCMHPKEGAQYTDKNAGSLVLRLSYGEFSMLLTGDLEETGEREILEWGENISCDILKAGHHGSRFSTTGEWIEKAQPKLTLISCGQDNSYGHPHEETLERLENAQSRWLLTAEQGAVTIRSDGKSFWAQGYKSKND
ncbi:ComEC/Rec2 family competence protein [Candidatus Merdisoma sp. JLR.KK006]|uniref:ComEC/Rec2 family competence protein n=1 Tax=Candidatus Merdisoma sp. JLR.KK006 TaxID=3112626 RepID=UPI002FEEB8F1